LAYYGRLSAEYVSFLEVSERNYMYQLLVDQLDEEKTQREKEEQKSKSKMGSMPRASSHPRR